MDWNLPAAARPRLRSFSAIWLHSEIYVVEPCLDSVRFAKHKSIVKSNSARSLVVVTQ